VEPGKGWPIYLSSKILDRMKDVLPVTLPPTNDNSQNTQNLQLTAKEILQISEKITLSNNKIIVGVLGLFNKGKTFCLNKIAGVNLPSSKKITTKGLSFKEPIEGQLSKACILLDTAGLNAPLKTLDHDTLDDIIFEKAYEDSLKSKPHINNNSDSEKEKMNEKEKMDEKEKKG